MKELSIEEKEKARLYDEAIERAKSLLSDNQLGDAWIYKLLPELKESEDEKIRKSIILLLQRGGYMSPEDKDKAFAWLKGQDGKKWIYEDVYLKEKEQVFQDGIDEVLENPQKYGLEKQEKDNMGISEVTRKELEDNLNMALEKETPESWNKFLDEQGELSKYNPYKETVESISTMVDKYSQAGSDLQDFYDNVKVKCKDAIEYDNTFIEKQDEQNPADEVKPKFKVGDWIVNKQNEIARINQIREDTHGTQRYHIEFTDETKTYPEPCDADDDYHLWTIQDAKEGDVLANNGNIILFKEISNSARQDYKYIKSHCFVLAHSLDFYTGGSYNLDDGFHPTTQEQHNLLFSKMKESGYEWDVKDKVLKKIEQKPDWNEEDDRHLSIAIQYVFEHGYLSTLNWLKSIKDRVIPQTKQEWSEESEIMLDRLIKHFNKNDFDRGYEVGVSAAKFNQWKPTEEQMSYFASAIERFDFCDPEHAALEAIYTHFKNLQNQ